MAPPQLSKGDEGTKQQKSDLPPEIIEIILPALQIGGISGVTGFTFGAFAGVLRSTTPALFALASGIQWFTLGTTFSASRTFVLQAWGEDKVSPKERIYASTIAGSIAGASGGLLRSRKNILPGAFMFALFGLTGQYIYNRADAAYSNSPAEKPDLKDSWLNSKWSPVKVLSDEEYENMLQEKLLRVNAEIALVDESINVLRAQEREMKEADRKEEVKGIEVEKMEKGKSV